MTTDLSTNSNSTKSNSKVITFVGTGATSKKDISVKLELKPKGHGIVFELASGTKIAATANNVVNTMRNVTLGLKDASAANKHERICIVEHILSALAVYGHNDVLIYLDGMELPLGDGSAKFWIDLFVENGWTKNTIESSIELKETIVCQKQGRELIAIPDEHFSVTYLMDWNHPMIGKKWQSWSQKEDISAIMDARTFGSLKEHQMLGLADKVVSLTETGFTHELRFDDEPVRHKLLDLIGDLVLCGVNPLSIKAKFISIKAGHELDVELATKLMQVLK
jgi:UDP-3-O-[3-hydroxymyristoyl] N-acetylglucosamine deacetylase